VSNFRVHPVALAAMLVCAAAGAGAQDSPEIVWKAAGSTAAVAVSPDGSLVAGGRAAGAAFWRAADGTPIRTVTTGGAGTLAVNSLAFSPDGKSLAAAHPYRSSRTDQLELWRVVDGALLYRLMGPESELASVIFTRDGATVVSGGMAGREFSPSPVNRWRVSDGAYLGDMPWPGGFMAYGLAFTQDGTLLAAASTGYTQVWRVSDWTPVAKLASPDSLVRTVAFSPDGSILAAAGDDKVVQLWRVADWSEIGTLTGYTQYVNSVAFSPDGSILAVAAGRANWPGGEVTLWRVTDGARLKSYALDPGESGTSVAFSPDGAFLVYGTSNAVVVARNPYAPPAGRADTSLAVQPAGGPIGQDVTLSARLTSAGVGVVGRAVTLTVGADVLSAVTDGAGTATVTYRVPEGPGAGVRSVTAAFEGDAAFAPTSASGTLTVTLTDTFLYVVDRSTQVGRIVYLKGYLYRRTDRGPVAGRSLAFWVDGTVVGSAETDSERCAVLPYSVPEGAVGDRRLTVSWFGDGTYTDSKGSASLTVGKADTYLWPYSRAIGRGQAVYLRMYLRRLPDYRFLAGKAISFSLDNTLLGTSVTDDSGIGHASWLITVPHDMAPGDHAFVGTFAGDANYNGTSRTGTLTVN
jgi:sugar lactone lactonase YvrE